MSNYNTFLGIDIGKSEVVVGVYGSKSTQSFPNSIAGFKAFFKSYKKNLHQAFVVLETTGGYEQLFLNALLDKTIAVHRANTRQVKNFIRSWGQHGKSDALDAQALAVMPPQKADQQIREFSRKIEKRKETRNAKDS